MEGEPAGVQKEGRHYRYNVYGNEAKMVKVGGGGLVCCGIPMEKISG
jgi:desulfoferrodoxin-like iron-binding protein